MKKLLVLLSSFLLIVVASILGVAQENREKTVKIKTEEIKWLSYDEAAKLSTKKPRKIFIDVYTDWCGWCKRMDKTTMQDAKVIAYMNKKYYAVKLNAESGKKIEYKGKSMTEQELASQVFHATGFPTTVYLDESQNVLQPLSGYLEADVLTKILHYFGDDYYKNTSWEDFQASYNPTAN